MSSGLPVKNIRWVVLSQMNRMGITDQRHYERMEQFAFECYQQELKVRAMASIEVYREKVDSLGLIQLPDDYIRYTKIGICRKDGRIHTLTLDPDLCPKPLNVCESLEDAEQNEGPAYQIVPHLHRGAFVGGYSLPALYMVGGGINKDGYYRVDNNKRQVILDSVFVGSEIIVEYQSSGAVTGQTLVPELYIDPIRYYIAWKMYEYDMERVQLADREYQKFADYVTEAKLQENAFTLDELLDMLYQTSGHNIR